MRQQCSWFFAAFFITLFSTFSLVAPCQAHAGNQSVNAPIEQHLSALGVNKREVESLSLGITTFGKKSLQCEIRVNHHLKSLWFNTLYHPIALLKISYRQNLTTLFIQQQNIAARISELTLLLLATPAFLLSDTSAHHCSF